MIPQKQLNPHNPPLVWGDCFRACVASVLEMDPEKVPHFYDGGVSGPDAHEKVVEWAKKQELRFYEFPLKCTEVDQALKFIEAFFPDTYLLLLGKGHNDCGHVVVAFNDEIVHDPTLKKDKYGLTGPVDEELFWVGLFMKEPLW